MSNLYFRLRFAKLPIAVVALLVCFFVNHQSNAIGQTLKSHYIAMDDGVRLAVDVHLPIDYEPGKKFPALLELTRYWRSAVDPATGKSPGSGNGLNRIDRGFSENGYVLIKVDVRGSCASFGHRMEEYGPREVRDGYAIVDWVATQNWCDGNVGAYGISYSGTTAELIASSKHPALKAVIPGWSDFDMFASPGRPYGLCPFALMTAWGEMVGWMDENNTEKMGASVRPVDPSLLSAALKDHEANPDVAKLEQLVEFRDVGYLGSRPMRECTSVFWKKDIEASKVPMLVFASWLDAGTADGALLRFQHYTNPQYLVILASSHGGMFHASPFVVGDKPAPPVPGSKEQFAMWLAFMNHYLKGEKNEVTEWPPIRYFNMGEEKMHESDVWPPANVEPLKYYFTPEADLSDQLSNQVVGHNVLNVDFEANTGTNNRWMTQMGLPVFNLHRREKMDGKMQCYTTSPLAADLQITGTPEVHLWLSASQADGAVLAYLEDLAPDGQSRYITEGGLRFMHRKLTPDPELPKDVLTHSFAEKDKLDLVPGEITEVAFKMWPTSVRIEAGHRVRIAIAGADMTTFQRIPVEGEMELTLFCDGTSPSHVVLPVIRPNKQR